MRIDGIRIEGGEVILTTSDPAARKLAYNFQPGEYELKRVRKKRSLNANAYCWELCQQIAQAVGETKENVYKRNIREVGSYTPMPIKEDALDKFKEIWGSHGVGWFVEVIDNSKLPGYKLVFAYHGSSTYNTKEMSMLIESLIQDAKSIGLDTLSEREKSLLLVDWENGKS